MATSFTTKVNRIALATAVLLFAALGALWWRERSRAWEAPRWPHPGLAIVAPPAGLTTSERWIVAVNPDCGSCRARLADLRRRLAAMTADVALGVLLVDVPRRPQELEVGDRLEAGVWWDSLGVWRSRWGHRVYGETLVFGHDGDLVRVIAPTGDTAPAP